jgi:transposase
MAAPFGQQQASSLAHVISVAQVDHLPIIAHYARQLGLVEIINRLVPVEMDVEPGIIVLGLVLDTLSGRSPLYHLENTFADYDQKVLFGRELSPGYFSDDNVGRIMDHIYAIGTQRIFSALSISTLQRFDLSTKHVHFDTTSVNVFGDYLNTEADTVPFKITHGYSKDKRPDLKQFVLRVLQEALWAAPYFPSMS